MQYAHLPGIEKAISRLVQGTAMIHSGKLKESFALLDAVLELGCNTFDTAHSYNNGDTERTVGRWARERGVRERIVIIGKGALQNQDRKRITPFDISADIFDSLARFQFDAIDLYLLHVDDPQVPVGPIVQALNEHLRAGRLRAFGGSNWTHGRVQEANAYAEAHGLVPFVASSPNFSLAEWSEEPWPYCLSVSGAQGQKAREWYAANKVALFTWSSLAGGFFSGRFSRHNLDTFGAELDRVCIKSYCQEENFKRLDRAQAMAREKSATVTQIAMAYVMSQPLNIFAVVGCQNGREFQANREASSMRLTPEEIAWLESGAE